MKPSLRFLLCAFLFAGLSLTFTSRTTVAVVQAEEEEERPAPKPKEKKEPEKEEKPRDEKPKEEEDKKTDPKEDGEKPKKKITVDDEEKTPKPEDPEKSEPENEGVPRLDDVARGAGIAPHPALREFLKKYIVVYDKLVWGNGKTVRLAPLPQLWGKDRFKKEFPATQLNEDNTLGEASDYLTKKVSLIHPFERIAIEGVKEQMKESESPVKGGPRRADSIAACERILAALLLFHDSARERKIRQGKSWDIVKTEVIDNLRDVRIVRLDQAASDRDWALLREQSTRYAEIYKGEPKTLERVFAMRLAEAEELAKSERPSDLEHARELLGAYESRFVNTGNERAKRIRTSLKEKADRLLADASKLFETNQAEARAKLKIVEAITPDNPSLRGMQQQLKAGYTVLIVGTTRLPEMMSPTKARFDSERQAVQLMFEGLMESVPDAATGVRYEPALASDRPVVGAGSRELSLVRNAEWSGPDKGVFDAGDIAGTIHMLRKRSGLRGAETTSWWDDPTFDPADPGRVKLKFLMGHPDPRSLSTLKIHPAQWLHSKNKTIDDIEFARRPFGTGPYKLAPEYVTPPLGEVPQNDVVFVADPSYGRRPGKIGRPAIKEIRFTDLGKVVNLADEIAHERIHIATDIPTSDLPKFQSSELASKIRVVTPLVSRRIHLIALNHRRPAFQSVDLRRGLTAAIDREKILNDVFRAGKTEFHKSLAGPFPPASWAAPKAGQVLPLYNRDVAQSRIRRYLGSPNHVSEFELCYPKDDPKAKPACERIKAMVETVTSGEEGKIVVKLEGLEPQLFHKRVAEEHRYDMAYVPFDYDDDWYPQSLAAYLDPTADGIDGRNIMGCLTGATAPNDEEARVQALLAETRRHRDPAKLEQLAHDIHRKFNDAALFIPLWQLDRHMVMAPSVKIGYEGEMEEGAANLLHPTLLFQSIARWRME